MKVLIDATTKRAVHVFLPNQPWLLLPQEVVPQPDVQLVEVEDFTPEDIEAYKADTSQWNWRVFNNRLVRDNSPTIKTEVEKYRQTSRNLLKRLKWYQYKHIDPKFVTLDAQERNQLFREHRYQDLYWYERTLDKATSITEMEPIQSTIRLSLQNFGEKV